jgi:hypothetical protein
MLRAVSRCALIVALFFACHRPEVDVNEDNLCAEQAEVVCYDLYHCCDDAKISTVLGVAVPPPEALCRALMTAECESWPVTAQLRRSLELGRVELETEAFEACLEALIAPAGCTTVATEPPWRAACSAPLWTGQVADGGDCSRDDECAGVESYCHIFEGDCRPLPRAGEPCADSVGVWDGPRCAPGFMCRLDQCEPRPGEGDPCDAEICLEELICDPDTGTCTTPRQLGEPCKGYDHCATGYCRRAPCEGTLLTCYEDADCEGRCADGGPLCDSAADCGAGTCRDAGTLCEIPANCVPGDECIYPVACEPIACLGEAVCAELVPETYHYCDYVRSAFPLEAPDP